MEKEYYELTNPQKNIWMVDLVNKGSNINNIAGVFYIKGDEFKYEVHNKVLNQLIKQNDAMRIRIITKNGEPYQYIEDFKEQKIDVINMSLSTEKEFNVYIKNEMIKPIDVVNEKSYDFKIIKMPNMKTCIFFKFHHIIADAWGVIQVATQYSKIYEALFNKIDYEIEIPSYLEYINSEKEYINSEKYENDKLFWENYLKGIKDSVGIKSITKKTLNKSGRYNVKINKKLNSNINKFCKENKISVYNLFMTILAIYLHRTLDKDDFIIGTPILNRSNFKEKKMLGMFISTVPMRFKIEKNMKFKDLLKNTASDTMSVLRHQKYPYSKILEKIYKNTDINNNLYQISLSYQNARIEYPNKEKYNAIWKEPDFVQNQLDLHIIDINNTGNFEICYDYMIDLFKKEEIKFIHLRLITMIQEIIKNDEKLIKDINIISEKEKILMDNINETYIKLPKNKNVVEYFEKQAKTNSNKIALVYNKSEITYKELNELSNQIAHTFFELGIKQNDTVAVYINRNEFLIATLIAILKCGATYIPIDPEYPEERVKYILNNSKSKHIITNFTNYDFENANIININELKYKNSNKENLDFKLNCESLAYIIYTSGSTGNPKGVMINNINLINFLYGINKDIKLSKKDNLISITTISFDIFGLEIWLTLMFGAKLILANEQEQIDSNLLNKVCVDNKATIIQTTPTKLRLLTSEKNNLMYIKKMKKILLGGENLPEEYINKIKKITTSRIINVYGPTETTIWSTIKDITKSKNITAGKPIQNTKLYILDNENNVLPIGVAGQLAISGDSVSKGYYRNDKLTEEQFIINKFNNERMYLTGDLALIDFNQELKILGRIDFQIKLNGQRIELEEIEKKISKNNDIEDSVVVLKDNKLVCFYLSKKNNLNNEDFRKYLQKYLPAYMIPSIFEKISEFPLTANGKIDRKKLLEYKINTIKKDIVLPITTLQKKIYDSWKIILKNKEFGIDSNFFELGDSLDAIKLRIELLKKDIKIDYSDIFKFSTIREISEEIEKKTNIKEYDISGYNKDFSNILNSNKNFEKSPKKNQIGNVLLTGVTGFLGAHIVADLIDKEESIVYCLIRSKDDLSSEERLKQKLRYYFNNKYDDVINKRVFALDGDIIEKDLGMNKYKEISKNIDFVVHSAACVKHYGNKEYFFDINIKGTENVAKYCFKNNKKMIHISTLSVSGNAFESAFIKQEEKDEKIIFDETCFYNGQNVDNVYVYTKFKAEECILEYMEKGLQANIIRCGNLTGRYTDLKFQDNIEENAFAARMKSIVDIGYIPKSCYDMYLEFTPVDLTSEFIVKIMENFNLQHNMFHAFNHNHIYVNEFLTIIKSLGINIVVIEDNEFSNYIKKLFNEEKSSSKLVGIINDINAENSLDYSTNVEIKSDNTIKYLNSIGFEWKKIDKEYIQKYIEYLKDVNFLNKE